MIDKIGHIDILWNQSKILYNQDRSFSLSLPPPPLPTNACFLRHTHAHVSAPTNTHTHTHTQWDIKRANICHIFVIKVNNPLNPTRTCKTTGSWLSSSHPALNLNPSHFRHSETSFAISIRFFFFFFCWIWRPTTPVLHSTHLTHSIWWLCEPHSYFVLFWNLTE